MLEMPLVDVVAILQWEEVYQRRREAYAEWKRAAAPKAG